MAMNRFEYGSAASLVEALAVLDDGEFPRPITPVQCRHQSRGGGLSPPDNANPMPASK